MTDTAPFALVVLITASVALAAVLSHHLTAKLRIPPPALFLLAASIAVRVFPALNAPSGITVERTVTVALLFILFDGGMNIGWARFRSAVVPIAAVGVVGTFLTVAAVAVLAHFAFDLGWYVSVLVATAVAPTDPAVVFSVLGQREVAGRSSTILEGEAGANDPVGIALMTTLIAGGSLGWSITAHVGAQFALQMGVGLVVGVVGGRAALWFMRRVTLPREALYPLRTAACALIVFGVTTLVHGSGYLAVFVAGIVLGDERAPYKAEIARFHSALASLAEVVAFVVLGLSVDIAVIGHTNVWVPGLIIGATLALVVRPLLVGLCLIPARLASNERNFVLFAGLKGAVPILLGSFLLTAHVPGAARLYAIIVVVVMFSVIVQGSLVSTVARVLHVTTRTIDPEPWGVGMRVRDEPSGVHRFSVASGSPADGSTIENLPGFPVDAWVSLVVRGGQLVPVRSETTLLAEDEVLILADDDQRETLASTFEARSAS
jgi:cell volume regulation protein A